MTNNLLLQALRAELAPTRQPQIDFPEGTVIAFDLKYEVSRPWGATKTKGVVAHFDGGGWVVVLPLAGHQRYTTERFVNEILKNLDTSNIKIVSEWTEV